MRNRTSPTLTLQLLISPQRAPPSSYAICGGHNRLIERFANSTFREVSLAFHRVAFRLQQVTMEVREYQTADGKTPLTEWLEGLRDGATRARIVARLDRLKTGLLGY